MFGAVMTDPENCKGLLELLLHKKLDRIIVSTEKSMIYHPEYKPEYKGVRLDVYAKDDTNTRYNIEMQVLRKSTLGKRSRYYHSQIDMDLLLSGSDYRELPDTYVIFICDFDPFGFGKYLYSFYTACREEDSLAFNDGLYTIFLSTAGKNESEVPEALVSFLKFVKADLSESSKDFHKYNIEMQVLRKSTLGKRSRYYHSQIDMDLLLSGSDYRELPYTYVIFICDFDPFGFGKYLYSFYTSCREEGSLAFNDGLYTILFSTAGKNKSEVPEALVSFLKFVKADLSESSKDLHNE